jgi:hypothetical protein
MQILFRGFLQLSEPLKPQTASFSLLQIYVQYIEADADCMQILRDYFTYPFSQPCNCKPETSNFNGQSLVEVRNRKCRQIE